MRRRGILLTIALIAVACGGGTHSSTTANSAAGSTNAPAAGSATTALSPGAGPGAGSRAGSGPTTAPVGGPPAPAPGATAPRQPPPTVGGSVNRPGTGSALPAAPGLYRYRQSGSSTFGSTTRQEPGEGTLRVDPVQGDGNQVDHRTVDSSQPPSDSTFAFRSGGVFLVQTVMRSSAGGQEQTFTCNFAPPLPTPPWPPRVGSTFAGAANCGSFTIDVSGTVTGTKDVAVSGATHHTFVLNAKLTFHGQVEGSGTEVDWVDPATSLIIHQETTTKATYSGFLTFSSAVTSDIESTRPS